MWQYTAPTWRPNHLRVTSATHACMHSASCAHACRIPCRCTMYCICTACRLHLYWTHVHMAQSRPPCTSPDHPIPPCSMHRGCGGAAMRLWHAVLQCTAASVLPSCTLPPLGTPCTHACLPACKSGSCMQLSGCICPWTCFRTAAVRIVRACGGGVTSHH
jgi:hypothetical protein